MLKFRKTTAPSSSSSSACGRFTRAMECGDYQPQPRTHTRRFWEGSRMNEGGGIAREKESARMLLRFLHPPQTEKYRVRQENSLLEIEKRAALGSTSQCSHCCPLIHFLWVILLPNPVVYNRALPMIWVSPLLYHSGLLLILFPLLGIAKKEIMQMRRPSRRRLMPAHLQFHVMSGFRRDFPHVRCFFPSLSW